ncbi:Phosphatidylglycerophosphate synthase [Streptomyces zhaozhouensis]|uniref:Phosphatidylglycerophosphate synthase n=1 Tax=Streptomyces zhaozhouensis TaxID=1300267 RepID=A0A286DUU7_9ACTN|nr:DUF5941 domain-containing protein [Streptomyces zhaozhouensis]SOD62418.1 Phosphatidylglycerophosphate synthase [Streptomyces zhaozhouensis]
MPPQSAELSRGVSQLSSAILTGPPDPGSSLEDELRALGFTVSTVRSPGELAEAVAAVPAGRRVALVDPRFVGHRHSLRLGLTDPRFATAAVPGALTAAPAGRRALASALAALAGDGADREAASGGLVAPPEADRTVDRLAVLLAEAGAEPHRPELGTLVAEVPVDEAARARAVERVAAVDDEAVRLRTAVKSRDGFTTTHLVSPYSRYVARWCARRGLTPNQVTTASLLTALIAAGCAATGERWGFVAAGVLLLASFVLDCADGQLARYALKYSTLGAWLDATFDRAKEYAFYAGLALGAARSDDDVWALALGAMILGTCRHIVDFAFNESHPPAPSGGGAANAISGRLDRIGWTVWARRMIVLPIGERWLLIAVLTALTTPRTTLVVLLVASTLAACYTTAGRLLRSLRGRGSAASAPEALAGLADNGPLAALAARPRLPLPVPAPALALLAVAVLLLTLPPTVGEGSWLAVLGAVGYALLAGRAAALPLDGRLDWLLPPLFRAGEYLTILLLAAHSEVNGALPAAFCLVAASAYHHYDTVYRLRGGAGAPPRWLVNATGGHEGRALVVTVAAALWAGGQGFTLALATLAGVLALLVLAESIRFWVSSQAPAVHDESGEPA